MICKCARGTMVRAWFEAVAGVRRALARIMSALGLDLVGQSAHFAPAMKTVAHIPAIHIIGCIIITS